MADNRGLKTQDIPAEAWFKSSYSGAGSGSDCVEIAAVDGGAAIRDSKNKAGGLLRLHSSQMAAFVNSVKAGEFDLPA
ncbi:DUF397 domain-containing protein [Streptomyces sp. NPDC017260]|uniref:DUF397 domain-containing protein n=1 Tax=unclassified Streptomyces TaxID=2593676 RepID=UPI00379A42A8